MMNANQSKTTKETTNQDLANLDTSLEALKNKLIGQLEEKEFYLTLSNFIKTYIKADEILIYKVIDNCFDLDIIFSTFEMSSKRISILYGEGILGNVTRTKNPYFSNNLTRDPLYIEKHYNPNLTIAKELVLPFKVDGKLIGTLHLQNKKDSPSFSFTHVELLKSILSSIEIPLTNLHLYVSAKNLNKQLSDKALVSNHTINNKSNPIYEVIDCQNFTIMNSELKAYKAVQTQMKAEGYSLTTLNIIGKPGSGKKSWAKYIHTFGPRRGGQLLLVNCQKLSSFSQSLKESEEKLLSLVLSECESGTLILSHFEYASESVKNWMLQEKTNFKNRYRTKVIGLTSEVVEKNSAEENRNISSSLFETKVNLHSLAKSGEDLKSFTNYFLFELSKNNKSFSEKSLDIILKFPWNGNLHALKDTILTSLKMSNSPFILPLHLPEELRYHHFKNSTVIHSEEKELDDGSIANNKNEEHFISLQDDLSKEFFKDQLEFLLQELGGIFTLDYIEKKYIYSTLQKCKGNKTKASKKLGLSPKTLYNKFSNYDTSASDHSNFISNSEIQLEIDKQKDVHKVLDKNYSIQ